MMHAENNIHPDASGFVTAYGKSWTFDSNHPGRILLNGRKICFDSAKSIVRSEQNTGLGHLISTVYSDFEGEDLRFETRVLVFATEDRVDCTFVPLQMDSDNVQSVLWPPPLCAGDEDSYAVLNTMQGQLLPATWPEAIAEKLPFDGHLCTESAYMPWWGEISPQGGYLAYVRAPWDSAYTINHPAGGPTRIFVRHLPSLGKMTYARTLSYFFFPSGCTHVSLCKRYRQLAEEEGKAVTLREKAVRNPGLDRLLGSAVFHCGVKTHISPDSAYYDVEHPERNDVLIPFSAWEKRVRELKAAGVDRLYLHLDGWGQPGYDNQHPDYLPPCSEAGGIIGLKHLNDTLHELGYQFGLHDQYRDYYLDARSYDPDNAILSAAGDLFQMARWAGGKQNYLCASLAPDYVKRNFETLFSYGLKLDATYLDVFTCNEPDECINPHHRMTRSECLAYRCQCFHYLTSKGILPSSEEVNDWAMASLVFCHWAPYLGSTAIPAPLFNLVYHDCVIIPWMLCHDQWGLPKNTSGFLHALLNGGIGYISDKAEGAALEENIRQWQVVSRLHLDVGLCEMVSHEYLSDDYQVQRSVFSNGTRVTVDFTQETYLLEYKDREERGGVR